MSRPATSYGQFHVAEAPSALLSLHQHQGQTLREVEHPVPMAVLEQENFGVQGIDTSQVVPGAPRVDALGNCVLNAGTVALSAILPEAEFLKATGCTSYGDTKGGEEFAIRSYHGCTDQTGTPSQEWPPTDCGSSGPYLFQYYQDLGLVKTQQIAHGAQNIVSLLQTGGILEGGPFLNAWEEPPANGIVDGNGTASELEDQLRYGMAGGHETYQFALPKLTLSATGLVEPDKTLIRVRNSWGASWGDQGTFLIHLSTLVALGSYFDFRQFAA